MAKRKPSGMSFESWVDRQIRQARDDGAYENLPGAGKPIEGLDKPHDELWWLRQLIAREDLDVVPGGLGLRRDVERAMARLGRLRTERAVRRLIGELNVRIAKTNATTTSGPPTDLALFDVDEIVRRWSARRKEEGDQ